MQDDIMEILPEFLSVLGLDEEPMGIFYTDEEPDQGFSPKSNDLPTREKEMKNEIDWQMVFGQFSCVIGHIWRARKKAATAYFSAQRCGESFLTTKTWTTVQKMIERSKKAWGETS